MTPADSSHLLAEADYDVLNAVALKKMAGSVAVASALGRPADEVAPVLADLEHRGLVVQVAGSALPSDAAVPALEATAAERYATVREDAEVVRLVERFEVVNGQFLVAMTSWQQVDVAGRTIANDHRDAAYDGRVLARLGKLVDRLGPLVAALAAHDRRFARYEERFAAALAEVDAGRPEFVSSPTLDSVHTVWFELHEDLLRTLGRERRE